MSPPIVIPWVAEDVGSMDLYITLGVRLVSFISWYPGVLDACTLSLATGFVGTSESTLSLMAKLRVETWNGGVARTVRWGRKDADAGQTGLWKSASGF